jgi:hypothetical protein
VDVTGTGVRNQASASGKKKKGEKMKFRKYVETLVGTVGELSADDVTYVFAVRPGTEAKSPAKLIKVDEDFVIVEVKFRRSKVHRVIPLAVFSLCVSEE